MTKAVKVVKSRDSILHAREIMEAQRINQLPVMIDGRLAGIITDRDLRDAFPSVFEPPAGRRKARATAGADPKAITVEMVMTPHVLTLPPTASVAEAAKLMRTERIGAVPIVDKDRLVGIITRSDLLDALVAREQE
jgi:acetoin utilization protein AcuB